MELINLDETDPVLNYIMKFRDEAWEIKTVEKIERKVVKPGEPRVLIKFSAVRKEKPAMRPVVWEYNYLKYKRDIDRDRRMKESWNKWREAK